MFYFFFNFILILLNKILYILYFFLYFYLGNCLADFSPLFSFLFSPIFSFFMANYISIEKRQKKLKMVRELRKNGGGEGQPNYYLYLPIYNIFLMMTDSIFNDRPFLEFLATQGEDLIQRLIILK